ncbi:PQQ-like beta-propeller repeat protein [Vulcanisaeta souniana]|nr:PQQ-like beta-propeller repeat protein [Vulcanisaeta souniana]
MVVVTKASPNELGFTLIPIGNVVATAVSPSGYIAAVTNNPNGTATLFLIDNGKILWSKPLPAQICVYNDGNHPLTFVGDEYIIVADCNSDVMLININGGVVWVDNDLEPGNSATGVDSYSDLVLVTFGISWNNTGAPDAMLLSLSNGEVIWMFTYQPYTGVPHGTRGYPLFSGNGYFAFSMGNGWANGGTVFYFNNTGQLVWSYTYGGGYDPFFTAITPSGDYVIVQTMDLFNVNGGNTTLFNLNGQVVWSYVTGTVGNNQFTGGNPLYMSPNGEYFAVATDGVGSQYNGVYLFSTNGLMYHATIFPSTSTWSWPSVIVFNNGTVIAGLNNQLYELDTQGNVIAMATLPYDISDSIAITTNGQVVAVGTEGGLIILAPSQVVPQYGNAVINVFNVNGKPASTVPGAVYGLLMNSNFQVFAWAYMNSNSQLIFSNVPPGTYVLYIYHYPNSGLNYTEYWGNLTVTVTAGQTSTYNFTRDMPWIENMYATQSSSGAYTINVVINNSQDTSLNGVVTVYVSSQESQSSAQVLTQSVTLSPGTNTVTFTYTPSQPGTYYAYAVLNVTTQQPLGQPIATDQYSWTQIIQASSTTTSYILVGDAQIQNNALILTNDTPDTYGAVFWQSYFDSNKVVNLEINGSGFSSTGSVPGDGFVFYLFLNPSNWGIGPQFNNNVPSYSISGVSPVMGNVFFPQSTTPYIVVQWDPIWQNVYRQVGVVGQWNVWIIGPKGQVIKAWNGIGSESIFAPYSVKIEISYDPSTNTLMGIAFTWGFAISFFALNLNGYFTPPSSSNYVFGVGAATGFYHGEWYLDQYTSYYNVADYYVGYTQGSNVMLEELGKLINNTLYGIGLPGYSTAVSLSSLNLVSVDFSGITNYVVTININDYTNNGVTYIPIPSQLTINLTDLLWPQEAYTSGHGFSFQSSSNDLIYIVFISEGNEYGVVNNWNPFLDMYSYANYGTNYSPDGNCYGLSSTAILYFNRYIRGENTIDSLVVPYYPLQDYGLTTTPAYTAQLYLGYVNLSDDLLISPPQYNLMPAALEIAVHQFFDPNNYFQFKSFLIGSWAIVSLTPNDFNLLINILNSGHPVALVMFSRSATGVGIGYAIGYPSVIHAVVAWGYAKLANGSYAILISDPVFPGTIRVAIYNPSTDTFHYTWPDGTTYITFFVIEPTPARWSWFSSFSSSCVNVKCANITEELSPYTLIVVYAGSQSNEINAKVYLKGNSSMYDTFNQWGDSQSFVGYIPGSTGVFDGDVEVFAIPNQYDGDLEVDPIGTSVGIFIMQVSSSSIKGFLINATSSKPINVTIGLRPYGLTITSSSSASLNVTGFYMSSTRVIVNSTTAELEPNEATIINSTDLIGVPFLTTTTTTPVSMTIPPPPSYAFVNVIAPSYASWLVSAMASNGWYADYMGVGSMSFGPAYIGEPGTTVTFNVTRLGHCPSPSITYEPSNTLSLNYGPNYETIIINCEPTMSVALNVTSGGGVIALVNEPGLGQRQLILNGPTIESLELPINTTITIYAWPLPGFTVGGIYVNGNAMSGTNLYGAYVITDTVTSNQKIITQFK